MSITPVSLAAHSKERVKTWVKSQRKLTTLPGQISTEIYTGSAHYDDRALDFRGNNISNEQGEQWAEKVKSRLGSAYAVDFERFPDDPARDHLHVAKRRS